MIYTVYQKRNKFQVKYFDLQDHTIKELSGKFTDPGEASQEFQAQFPGQEHEHLTPLKFANQAQKIQASHAEDLRKLKAWNNG